MEAGIPALCKHDEDWIGWKADDLAVPICRA